MDNIISMIKRASWFRLAWKSIALSASTGAALVTVFSALYSYGVVGKAESHQSIGNIGAAWVGLRPGLDTATAIGDTVHFAATITDKSGSILVGAHPTWTTGDSSIAKVLPDGSVIARRPGSTTVSVVVGSLVAHSRVMVKQSVSTVELGAGAADSVVVIGEGATIPLHARALDARGHMIAGLAPQWQVDDSSVAAFETDGILTGRNAGRTMLSATVNGVVAHAAVSVVTTATALNLVAGTDQRAFAGNALPQPIVVRATNRRGAPSAGQMVTFRLPGGQGSVEPSTATTDADGRARTTWTLGEYPGRQTLTATVAKVDSALAIVAEADPVASNTRVSAVVDNFIGKAGESLVDSVAIRVTDSSGRALPDVPVRWTSLSGGSVDAGAVRTDSLGIVRASWTLARKTGTQKVRAQVGGGPGSRTIAPVTISAKALAGAPTAVVVVSGDEQRAAVGSVLPKPIMIRVQDANGSGVAAVAVALSPSGGTVSDNSVWTDSMGVARTRWTMGRMAGDYTLGVHVDGVKKLLKLTSHAKPATPANLSFDDAPPSHDKRAKSKGKHLLALITDVYGNPVPDAPVSFAVKSGSVSPARVVTDATGRAAITWVVGSKPGAQTLTGVVRGTDVKGVYEAESISHGAVHAMVHTAAQKTPAKKPKH
jgi:hypothetical protein